MLDFLSGRFAELQGLPLHPLVVHVVVILIPLSALGMIVSIVIKRWRPWLQWLSLTAMAVGFVGAYLAKLSGDSLAAAVGLPAFHAEWGNNLLPLVAAMLAVSGLWIWLNHLDRWHIPRLISAALLTVAALASIGMTYVVGHSGAEAVWEGQLAQARKPPAASSTIQGPIPMQVVAQYNTPEGCWSVVNGEVYDLTDFIARHPVGPSQIKGMCGKDATEQFNGEHGGQAEPEGWLEVFRIGQLAN